MPDDEKSRDFVEAHIPFVSGAAFVAANISALTAGLTVVNSDAGVIYEVAPDGTRKEIKRIAPPVPVVKGTTIKLS